MIGAALVTWGRASAIGTTLATLGRVHYDFEVRVQPGVELLTAGGGGSVLRFLRKQKLLEVHTDFVSELIFLVNFANLVDRPTTLVRIQKFVDATFKKMSGGENARGKRGTSEESKS